MSRPLTQALFAGALALLCGFLALGCKSGPSFTKGPRIGTYATPRTALLVVDVQEDYTGPKAKQPYPDADRILAAANAMITKAEAQGDLVIFIENVMDNPFLKLLTGGLNAPGQPGTAMDHRLLQAPGIRTFTKRASDAFANAEFEDYLRSSQVDHVIITGLDGRVCVDATARGALNRGYKVTMFTPGISIRNSGSLDKLAQRWREAGAEVQ